MRFSSLLNRTPLPATVLSGALLMGFSSSNAQAAITFAARTDYDTGSGPRNLRGGDFNGDGNIDLVTANFTGDSVSLLLGNANGTFRPKTDYPVLPPSPGSSSSNALALADFNGDGKLDVAVASRDYAQVNVLLGNGNGGLGTSIGSTSSINSFALASGDFNGDGKPDLASVNYMSNIVAVLIGNGNGTFAAPVNYTAGERTYGVAVADFNSDGKADLVVANNDPTADSVSVLFGNGNGTFGAAANYPAGRGPRDISTSDLNGDGKPDIIVGNFGSSTDNNASLSVLLNNGNGTFPTTTDYPTSNGSFAGTFAGIAVDLDGDNKPDLVSANNNGNTIGVRMGNGNGTFGAQTAFAAGAGPRSLVSGDFNHDGKMDIAVAQGNTTQGVGGLGVFLNTTTPTVTNTAPVINSVTITPTNPTTNTTLTANVSASDAQTPAANLTYTYLWRKNNTVITGATGQTLNLATAGNGDRGDSITVTVTASDGQLSSTAVTSSAVTVLNSPPTANDDTSTVAEDSSATVIDVLANDSSSPDSGETLSVTSVTQPTNGTVTLTSGVVRFTPTPNFNGTTTFNYTINDGNGGSDTATVTVTVTPVNDNPTANNDSVTVLEDSGATVINVLTNDSIAPDTGETLTVTAITQPAQGTGTVTLTSGVVRYTPALNFNGTTTFTYTISDGNGGTATATVTVTVTPVNDNPTASNDTATVAEDSNATVIDVLANDSSAPDTGETLTVTAVTQPANGTVTLASGVVRYKPNANFNGTDSFTYTISDGNGGTATATVVVTVTPVNDNPTANNDSVTLDESSDATIIDVLSNDSSAPDTGETLTVTAATQPSHGTVTLTSGVVRYKPTTNYNGPDSFTYTISDGNGGTATATVNITVTSVNDAPTIASVTVTPNAPNTNSLLTATVVASDIDGDNLTTTYEWKKNGQNIQGQTGSTLNLATAGNGDKGDVITVVATVSDGNLSTSKESNSVTVINTAPVLSGVVITPNNPTTNTVLTANPVASDIDGDGLQYSYQWKRNGTNIPGAIGNQLNLATAGNGDKGDVITVEVFATDGTANSPIATANGVTIQNTAPVVSAVSIAPTTPNTNSLLTATVVASDADNDTLTYTYVWKRNNTTIAGETGSTLDLSKAGNGNTGDVITVTVTANDGTIASAALTSASVTVGNTIPTISGVSITPLNPKTNDTLTAIVTADDVDGDSLNYSYVWKKNGTTIAGETSNTLDLSKAGNGDKGDEISVVVTVNDGTDNSAPRSSNTVTVANTAPALTDATINQNSPKTNDTLTISGGVASDVDGDGVTTSYQWRKNGENITGATDSTLDLSVAGNGDKGDVITVVVSTTDGSVTTSKESAPVTILNTTPVVRSVTITPSKPLTYILLMANVTAEDADGDIPTLRYEWRKNGSVIPGETGATLDLGVAGNGDDGDTITVTVTAVDGSVGISASVTSDSVTIGNDAPHIVSVTPQNTTDKVGDKRTFTITASDANGASDIKELWLLVNTRLNWSEGATFIYVPSASSPTDGLLYLRRGDSFLAPITIGTGADPLAVLDNGAVRVLASEVVVTVSDNTITLSIPAVIREGLVGTNTLFARVNDAAGALDPASLVGDSGYVRFGPYTVTSQFTGAVNSAPTLSKLTPTITNTRLSGSIAAAQNFGFFVKDEDGSSDIESVIFLAGKQRGWTGTATFYYEVRTRRLYLRSDNGQSWLGGGQIGTADIIENSQVRVDLSKVKITIIDGKSFGLTLPLQAKSTLLGQNKIWLRVQDKAGLTSPDGDLQGYVEKGTWNVVASSATPASPQPSNGHS